MSMELLTISGIAEALHKKKISAVELCQQTLAKAEKVNAELNCFITINREPALESARRADKLLSQNNESLSPLCGVPIAHKDLFCTDGIRTTCGSKMLENFIPSYNATLVKKLADCGVVAIAKTNMDEFAMGSSNATSYFGKVYNPFDKDKIPGGSSGGSAAAVSARVVAGATASDTGGSIRQPAALCGISGIKPTYGRVSRYGMIAFASSLDQAGVLATTAEDCGILLQGMIGHDAKDSTSAKQPETYLNAKLNQSLKGKTIGVAVDYFNKYLDAECGASVHSAIDTLKSAGAIIKEITLPHSQYSVPVYYTIAPAECSSNLSRFDGLRFGHRADVDGNIDELISRSRSEGFGDEVKRRILVGTYVLSAAYFDAYYLKALSLREKMKEDFQQAFAKVDAIIAPTCPGPAMGFNDESAQGTDLYYQDIYTISSNLVGLPAISIPCGMKENLPIGVQLIGNFFEESQILSIAHQYQQLTDWHLKQPQNIY